MHVTDAVWAAWAAGGFIWRFQILFAGNPWTVIRKIPGDSPGKACVYNYTGIGYNQPENRRTAMAQGMDGGHGR